MLVSGKPYRTIWLKPEDDRVVQIIDQTKLPWSFEIIDLRSVADVATAIRDMWVRGAGLIGATAGYGMYVAALEAAGSGSRQTSGERVTEAAKASGGTLASSATRSMAGDFRASLAASAEQLIKTRPTAVNLAWAVNRQLDALRGAGNAAEAVAIAKQTALTIADEDAESCRQIGRHGLPIIEEIAKKKAGGPVNILTHCNAGWLAFVDHGSATGPVYAAHDAGIPVHVWVDETRPRSQGARLTAWELARHGVPHTVIADNTGGHLMQHRQVDLVITGADRVTRCGDVANKIGTYLKALAARDNVVPFYVALPSSTFDWQLRDGVAGIPIEQRDAGEVTHVEGLDESGAPRTVRVIPEPSLAANYAFDVTPARLVTGLITERGVCAAAEAAICRLFPEKAA